MLRKCTCCFVGNVKYVNSLKKVHYQELLLNHSQDSIKKLKIVYVEKLSSHYDRVTFT